MSYAGYNKCQLVRDTSAFVVAQVKHSTFNNLPQSLATKSSVNSNITMLDKIMKLYSCTFLFLIHACNFFFWPLEGFEYEQLASNIRKYINTRVSLEKLSQMTEEELVNDMFSGFKIPLAKERVRLVREVCSTTIHKYGGSFVKIVNESNKSAVDLVNILTGNFPNFQDHAIYRGHQTHFYKRSQFLVAAIWGMYNGKGLGEFNDIDQLTMFADQRVPQILNEYKIMEYTKELQQKIQSKVELCSGCEEDVEIRAVKIIAVEMIKEYINEKLGIICITVEVDHFLWQLGEWMSGQIMPHHRTLTIYY